MGGRPWPPLLQRLVAPAVYKARYLAALAVSLPHSPARTALLRAQEEEINGIEADPEFAEMLGDLRDVAEAESESEEEPGFSTTGATGTDNGDIRCGAAAAAAASDP